MLADLEALAPPLIMAAAFLIGLTLFLRRQMGPRGPATDEGDEADNAGGASNADPAGASTDASHGPYSDQHKV